MPPVAITVSTASRLHFGLISLGSSAARQYGGVGVMVEPPLTRLTIEPAPQFAVAGPGAERAAEFAARWRQFRQLAELPRCRITITDLPSLHSGLGVGTQLGLSVASGLNAWCGFPQPPAAELAASVGRGLRSAVGTHGFLHGGMIFEPGKTAAETLAPLGRRIPLPADWRFVITLPPQQETVAGEAEQRAFAQLPDVPAAVANRLIREVQQRIFPAAESADFDAFSASVYQFGYQAGLSFAQVQGGPYNGPRLMELVESIRRLGIEGVGQSSWGSAVFALCPNQPAAERLAEKLQQVPAAEHARIWIAAPRNQGAAISR